MHKCIKDIVEKYQIKQINKLLVDVEGSEYEILNDIDFNSLNIKKIFMGFFDFMQEAIAIDLGTANTLIIHNDKVVVDEPSIVAKNVRTGDVIAIGKRAQQMHGKAHKDIELSLIHI